MLATVEFSFPTKSSTVAAGNVYTADVGFQQLLVNPDDRAQLMSSDVTWRGGRSSI
jgi:hypothetical protein